MEYIGEKNNNPVSNESVSEKELKLRSSFLMIGKKTSKYEQVMGVYEAIESIRQSELSEDTFVVHVKKDKQLKFARGLKRLQELVEDDSLRIERISCAPPEPGHLFKDDAGHVTDEEWLATQEEDVRKINTIVKEKLKRKDKDFKFSQLYRYMSNSLSEAVEKKHDCMIISSDFLIGLGFSTMNVTHALKSMERTMQKHGFKDMMVPLVEICHRTHYKGEYIANPIFKSHSSHCLIVPLFMVAGVFARSAHPSAASIEMYLSTLAYAVILYSDEKQRQIREELARKNLQIKEELENQVEKTTKVEKELETQVVKTTKVEKELETQVVKKEEYKNSYIETEQLFKVSEEQKESLRNVHKKSSNATFRYDSGSCLVFSISSTEFYLLCRTDKSGSFETATENGLRYIFSPINKKRDTAGMRPRLIMAVTGCDAPIACNDSIKHQNKFKVLKCNRSSIVFQTPPSDEDLKGIVQKVTGSDIRIFMNDGTVYQDGQRIDISSPQELDEENMTQFEIEQQRKLHSMMENTSKIVTRYNKERHLTTKEARTRNKTEKWFEKVKKREEQKKRENGEQSTSEQEQRGVKRTWENDNEFDSDVEEEDGNNTQEQQRVKRHAISV
ncbi:hypothetical protein SWSSV_gp078 [White spot syndrome virus]|uniref:Wsv231 n=1 Tax=White spot syndrome virus TaxID=342409 RepID=A0A0S2E6T9_9VIRU|nr:hypothetical protein SWSSV_gp078 [White spot syndrome virus]ALN66521.1 hypothetical protein [White spot syndrome virus]AWM67182.1 hypothetical protein [White spot syndrome virus]QVW09635.1 MAG: hypothetical protein KOBFAEHK_00020 [White spot syndrome virus]WUY11247.1 hypothetical protein [White spot syndrome virus]WUY11419.1 hypothetical protein [White spot syndrome virus]